MLVPSPNLNCRALCRLTGNFCKDPRTSSNRKRRCSGYLAKMIAIISRAMRRRLSNFWTPRTESFSLYEFSTNRSGVAINSRPVMIISAISTLAKSFTKSAMILIVSCNSCEIIFLCETAASKIAAVEPELRSSTIGMMQRSKTFLTTPSTLCSNSSGYNCFSSRPPVIILRAVRADRSPRSTASSLWTQLANSSVFHSVSICRSDDSAEDKAPSQRF